ncbi:hypothetical protein RhoFasGS6_03940 [Rhodococcus fascians]|uniref:hypothetical protein n=1 Tax=Rhodococcoides fascians TaxID=1828 RepID=UPI001427E013|nr:hypothetical protein [Rhodococcus fascians]
MRLRTLELPTVILGAACTTPFVIVLDRFAPGEEWDDDMANSLKSSTGAKGVVAFTEHQVELYNDVTEGDFASAVREHYTVDLDAVNCND